GPAPFSPRRPRSLALLDHPVQQLLFGLLVPLEGILELVVDLLDALALGRRGAGDRHGLERLARRPQVADGLGVRPRRVIEMLATIRSSAGRLSRSTAWKSWMVASALEMT